jgi:iron complex outermembrane receptor protein
MSPVTTLLLIAGALPAADSLIIHADPLIPGSATAARAELSATPGGTSLITRDELARGRTSTWRDALGTLPGVVVQSRFGAEESRLSLRGSGIQRTFHLRGIVLLQDGQPLNQADGGGDFQAVDPGLADHLIVRRLSLIHI